MTNDRKFYLCKICGNLVGMVEDSGVNPVCCGEKMTLLVPNTVDASKEKHVPVITRENGNVKVAVGSVAHPMLDEHYIMWMMVAAGDLTIRQKLSPGQAPEMTVALAVESSVTAYAYCNLHGLWKAEG